MSDFTEQQIQQMMTTLKWKFGVENNTRELAILELEDLKRKGCTLEHIGECHGCSASTKENSYCPLCDWEKRHPEYRDDELAMQINVLEAGGEEAYRAKTKAQEEAKKKAEEEANRATDFEKTAAAIKSLDKFYAGEVKSAADMLQTIYDILHAKTKPELQKIVNMA